MLVQLHQRLEEGLFTQENIVDLRVDIGSQSQVEHRNEGLLNAWCSLSQCVTVDGRRDSFKDRVEELRVKSTDMAESYS